MILTVWYSGKGKTTERVKKIQCLVRVREGINKGNTEEFYCSENLCVIP